MLFLHKISHVAGGCHAAKVTAYVTGEKNFFTPGGDVKIFIIWPFSRYAPAKKGWPGLTFRGIGLCFCTGVAGDRVETECVLFAHVVEGTSKISPVSLLGAPTRFRTRKVLGVSLPLRV